MSITINSYILIFFTIVVLFMFIFLLSTVAKVPFDKYVYSVFRAVGKKLGHIISEKERVYKRDVEIGKIRKNSRQSKLYIFLNDLIIDLGIKRRGATPYSFLALVLIGALLVDLIITGLVFRSIALGIVLYVICTIVIMCVLFTKANMAHNRRIMDIMESENIISNNIKDGVLKAVKVSINSFPEGVRREYEDLVDMVENQSYHISDALKILNDALGSTANNFIDKCIKFETAEEHGTVGVFSEVVRINGIKRKHMLRIKEKFNEVASVMFITCGMIYAAIAVEIISLQTCREFYLNSSMGKVILILDMLDLAIRFGILTYIRSRDI